MNLDLDRSRVLVGGIVTRARSWARMQSYQARHLARRLSKPSTVPLLFVMVLLPVLAVVNAFNAQAAGGTVYASGVTFPFNGVWLESADGGHYWTSDGSGLCRVDADPTALGGFSVNVGTCDIQAKKVTQATVGPINPAGSADAGKYYVYQADMSSKSGGPVRVTYDPNADPDPTSGLGRGAIVAGSGTLLGGLNTVGFFSDSGGNFKNSSVALGPCDHSTTTGIATTPCLALYLAFERSKLIERIDFVDQPLASQRIEAISKTTDKRKGVRFGIGLYHNAGGTDDLYIAELGGNGVSLITDVATCSASLGPSSPTVTNPPTNVNAGCAASVVGGVTTNFPQGMAVYPDFYSHPDLGASQYFYTSDSPRNATATVLRYWPNSGFQDVVSHALATPVPDLLNPGATQTAYTFILGFGINPHNQDVFIGDDPTFAILKNPPLNKGHVFTIAGAGAPPPADCSGTALAPTCPVPQPPQTVTPTLYAYGVTAPKGGNVWVPSDDGGHLWGGDHSQGLCRFDTVKAIQTTKGTWLADPVDGTAIGLNAINSSACDDGALLGSAGQTVYDDTPITFTDAAGVVHTNDHYLYVAQNDHLSQGVVRFLYDPSADPDPVTGLGRGMLVPGSAAWMAPNAGLNGDKANGLALGPCKVGAPVSCKHALYMGGLLDGFIRRINNPEEADPRNMTVDVVAMTTEQRAGTLGKGINGSMGMIGDELYLPENLGFTVVHNASQCPTVVQGAAQVCATNALPIGQFGFIFAAGVGVDPDPNHLRSQAGLVYGAISPGAANATIYQYDVATNTARIFTTQGVMPVANTAEAAVYCTTTCTRPIDPANPPSTVDAAGNVVPSFANMRFAQGIYVSPDDINGNATVFMAEDAFAGARGGRGHVWQAPSLPYPAGVTPVPTSTPIPATSNICNVTVNIPSLASGQTWWLQFTAHSSGQITATWTIPVAQSAQFLLYPGNPFAGLADPVNTGAKGGAIAVQNTSNTASFKISTAPNIEAAGTYTLQFFNASNAFGATSGTLQYVNDAATVCPTSVSATTNTIP